MSKDLNQTRLAVAALAACIVRTLGEQDATVQKRFEKLLEKAYRHLRDTQRDSMGAMETLRWTQEILKDL